MHSIGASPVHMTPIPADEAGMMFYGALILAVLILLPLIDSMRPSRIAQFR